MKRRKAIGGILAFTGLGVVAFSAKEFFQINSKVERGQLHRYLDLISDLADGIIPPSNTPGAKEAGVHITSIELKNCNGNVRY